MLLWVCGGSTDTSCHFLNKYQPRQNDKRPHSVVHCLHVDMFLRFLSFFCKNMLSLLLSLYVCIFPSGFMLFIKYFGNYFLSFSLRDAKELFLAVWGSGRLCHHEGQNYKSVKRLWLCQIQRPQLCADGAGDKATQS